MLGRSTCPTRLQAKVRSHVGCDVDPDPLSQRQHGWRCRKAETAASHARAGVLPATGERAQQAKVRVPVDRDAAPAVDPALQGQHGQRAPDANAPMPASNACPGGGLGVGEGERPMVKGPVGMRRAAEGELPATKVDGYVDLKLAQLVYRATATDNLMCLTEMSVETICRCVADVVRCELVMLCRCGVGSLHCGMVSLSSV